MSLSPWDDPPTHPVPFTHPRDLWAAAKQIDGLGGEWSYICFTYRALNFHFPQRPPLWAEPLRGFDELFQEVWLRAWARESGISEETPGGIPVTITVFRSVFSAPNDDWPLPEPHESSIGRHTVSILGIHDDNTLLFRHGWSDWPKNHALGRLSRKYIENYATELWITRQCGQGPLSETIEELVQSAGSSKFATIWRRSGRRGSEDVSGEPNLRIRWWESYSVQDSAPAEVVVLTLSGTIRVAVALVIYDPGEATIMDLFVWPTYRQRGYATLLEEAIARRAAVRDAEYLAAVVLDADVVREERRASRFLENRKYAIERHADSQVRIEGRRPIA
jgi:GNAT superfamily N-acetyltransferase